MQNQLWIATGRKEDQEEGLIESPREDWREYMREGEGTNLLKDFVSSSGLQMLKYFGCVIAAVGMVEKNNVDKWAYSGVSE